MQPLLQVKNLTKFYSVPRGFLPWSKQRVYAVNGIDFDLQAGQTLGLVGESGCGKSTLGKTLLRLIEPNSGQIVFDGEDITNLSPKLMRPIRRRVQIVFQDPYSSLNPRMKVGELVAEPLMVHKLATRNQAFESAARLLSEVGLNGDALNKYPHEFSGGQRQRIGIARALSLKPQLIVADEPVSALDVSVQAQILNLFTKIKKEYGLSYLFISHDLSVVKHISDIVAVMYLGRIVEFSESEVLYRNPLHPYTKALLSSIPKPHFDSKTKKSAPLGGDVPSPINPPSGCHFHPRCPLASEICREKAPELISKGENNKQKVACHHV
ncbi:MAG: dipeptide ABC transporter ATP-binding protein [Oligoflexales bacterium]|nr:dipeptide ABC transporter ATP-binding protein [Oligoflexales bacterium]